MDTIDVTLVIEGQAPVLVSGELDVEGTPSDHVEIEALAGETLSGHRVVVAHPDGRLRYAEPDATPLGPLLVTLGSAAADSSVTAVSFGPVDEPSWTWTPRAALYLTAGGHLSETPPTSGLSVRVGWALSSTRIFVHQGTSITLAT
ncbi:MAG: hypothetical protein JWM31_1268 [Solirubrobacterales bacterium]|nr:hypothetical protein [Solirubrobacterales bacterium]